jgi:tRNA(Ile)-lysidine synthetase-like protein
VALGRKVKDDFIISKEQGAELRKVLNSDKPNISLNVDGLRFLKEYDSISIQEDVESSDYEFVLNEPGVLDTKYFFLDFTKDSSDRNISLPDYPITIRNAKNDDLIEIQDFSKELRRMFIDWKMPISLRNRWPVILNKDGKIIYVPRYLKDFVINLKIRKIK